MLTLLAISGLQTVFFFLSAYIIERWFFEGFEGWSRYLGQVVDNLSRSFGATDSDDSDFSDDMDNDEDDNDGDDDDDDDDIDGDLFKTFDCWSVRLFSRKRNKSKKYVSKPTKKTNKKKKRRNNKNKKSILPQPSSTPIIELSDEPDISDVDSITASELCNDDDLDDVDFIGDEITTRSAQF